MAFGLIVVIVVGILLSAQGVSAQAFKPLATRNAALRYWIAFSLMQDPPADKETSELLVKVADGSAEWDEAKLGPIVEANRDAILTMQRATRLPECDWGLEYDLGPTMPIPPYAKARVLGNLNVLYGKRQAAHGDMKGAVETWLAGVRFAEQLPQGMSLIGVLVGKAVLLTHLRALDAAALHGGLDENARAEIAKTVRALPEYGFDWSEGWRFETYAMDIALKQMMASPDPKQWYTTIVGPAPPTPFVLPTAGDMNAMQKLMDDVVAAFHLPYPAAKVKIEAIVPRLGSANPLLNWIIPNPVRTNEARGEVQAARRKLLEDLGKAS